MSSKVQIIRLSEETLVDLLGLAVNDAEPDETMPPHDGPPGWTPQRQAAFLDFFRPMLAGLEGPRRTVIYGIAADGVLAGFIRMALTDRPGVVETGMWLGRSWRGKGIGHGAMRELLAEAARAGMRAVVAETTPGNSAAIGVLQRLGAVVTVRAEIAIDQY